MSEPASDRSRPRRRRRRWPLVVLAAVVLLPVLLVAATLLALRSTGVRHAVLARAEPAIRAATGVTVTARDFRVDLRRGVLDLDEVAGAVPGQPPFLTTARVHIEVDIASLRAPVIVMRDIEIDRPRLDLAAALPPPQAPTTPGTAPARRVDVLSLRVRGGEVAHGIVPARATAWVTAWSLAGINLDGSYVGELASATVTVAHIAVERPGGARHKARIELAGSGRAGGTFSVDALHLTGDGLDVHGSASGTAAAAGPLTATVHVAAQLARLAPELGSGGSVDATATVRLPERTVEAHIEATGLAVDALRPYVGAEVLDRAAAAGTAVDVSADLAGPFADTYRLAGTAQLTWHTAAERRLVATASLAPRLGGERLLDASATLDPKPGSERPVRVAFAATLLPDLPGTRHVEGAVAAASIAELAAGTLEPTTLTIDVPDLAAAYRELRQRWPRLVPPLDEIGATSSEAARPPRSLADARLSCRRQGDDSVGNLLTGALTAEITAAGPVSSPHAVANAEWRPEPGTTVTVTASGEPLRRRGEATVTIDRLRLALLRPGLDGVVSATAHASGSIDSYLATLALDGEALRASPGTPALDTLHVAAATDGTRVTVSRLAGAIGAARFAGTAEAALALPLADARLDLNLVTPVPQVQTANISLRLADGVLHVDVPGVDTASGSAALAATVPLGALRAIPVLADALKTIPVVMADGPIRATLDAPALDSCTLLPQLGLPDRPERLRAGVHAELRVDPADPTAALAEITLSGVRADIEDRAVTIAAPVRLQMADHRLVLPTVEIATADVAVYFEGEATLAQRFRPGEDPLLSLVTAFSGDIAGGIDTALLRPYLAGGVAAGELRFDAHASGTPAAPVGSFSLYGPEASFFWPLPYATRLTGIDVTGEYANGEAVLRSGRAALNGGTLTFSGGRGDDGAITARVALGDVRYRLDYGVSAVLDGDLRLSLPPAARGSLTGEVVLRRALLNRDIDLDRELVRRLLSPVTTAGTESGFLDTIDVDVALSTVDGVKVKNNVGDLALTWEPLAIGGTAWNWTIKGRVDVQPPGLVFAYGQTVRIDHGSFTFTGDPINDPQIELSTTSSLQDPSIGSLAAERGPLAALADQGAAGGAGEALASGVAGYFGERIGSRIAASLGLGTVSVRPVLIFGETDPGARLTITRDLSRNVAFAFSLDLRNAQRQTYLLDLHGFHAAPSLNAQVFTTDQARHGATVQQMLELGGGKRAKGNGPRVQRVDFTAPAGVSKRAMRGAIGYSRGDELLPGAAFDVEVEVATLLRERGYPDADVRVTTAPSATKPGRFDLAVAIDPGPRARFVFTGEKIPSGSRPLITSLYRTDYYEGAALAEMRKAAVRSLRAFGFLDPRVEIDVVRVDPADPASARTVTVHGEGGRRVALGAPRFSGIGEEEAALIASRFPTALERAELACAARDADARVLESLRVLGYPQGRIAGRELSADGATLAVTIAPGERTRVAEVAIAGLSAADEARLRPALPLRPGDPARAHRIALAALAVEDDLRERGFADATVRPHVVVETAPPGGVTVRLDVDAGAAYRVGEVGFDRLRWTRASLAERLVGFGPNDVFRPLDIAAARSRLARLGVFSSVAVDSRRKQDGTVDVTFKTVEQARFSIGYGVRWESQEGASAVVDAVDRNFLGRSLTLGARALYERKDQRGRLYLGTGDLLGSATSLQWFLERRRQTGEILQSDSLESTLGLTHPLGRAVTSRLYASYRNTVLSGTDDFGFPIEIRIKNPYLGAQLIADTRSDPLLGGEGVFASADLSGSAQAIGSDFRYLRLYTQLNLYRAVRVFALPATWAQSVRVGLAKPFAGQELITDVRFFAGGEYSVRGYPNEGIGPTETLGDSTRAVGGEALLVVNEELRVPLPWDLVGLAFADAGNVWAHPGDFGRSLVTSLGLGVRAHSPIGLLRLDAAFPLSPRPGDAKFTLYLGFGNAF